MSSSTSIPIGTIGALLHQIAENKNGTGKGNNIVRANPIHPARTLKDLYQTVILDCCHSGSGTRPLPLHDSARVDRGFELDHDIPPSLDESIWGELSKDRAIEVAPGFAKAGSKSHVLLAACRESERAGEKAFEDTSGVRGLFTRELINTLRSVATDKVTYRELFQRIQDIPKCVLLRSDRQSGYLHAHL